MLLDKFISQEKGYEDPEALVASFKTRPERRRTLAELDQMID